MCEGESKREGEKKSKGGVGKEGEEEAVSGDKKVFKGLSSTVHHFLQPAHSVWPNLCTNPLMRIVVSQSNSKSSEIYVKTRGGS